MLVGEFWSIVGQRNLVYCQGFRREKILKSDPLNPARDLVSAVTSRSGVWPGEKTQLTAANDFSDIWSEKSTKSDQLAAAWEAPGSASVPLLRLF